MLTWNGAQHINIATNMATVFSLSPSPAHLIQATSYTHLTHNWPRLDTTMTHEARPNVPARSGNEPRGWVL